MYPRALKLLAMPLGASSCLLLTALLLRRRPWASRIAIGASLLLQAAAGNIWVSNSLVGALESIHPAPDPSESADAIVVLGGGTEPAVSPRDSVEVKEQGDRVLYAARLYKHGRAPLVVTTGGLVAKSGGESFYESSDAARLLTELGVPSAAIVEESRSRSTAQNAANVRPILESLGVKRVFLVTSALHMPRAVMLFGDSGVEVIPALADYLVSESDPRAPSGGWRGFYTGLIPDARYFFRTTLALKELYGFLLQSKGDE